MSSTELRTFYLTGKGLDDCRPAAALRPLAFEPLDPAGSPDRPAVSFHEAVDVSAHAIADGRREARDWFLGELRQHAHRLEEMLAVDDSKASIADSAESLAASLGHHAKSLLDASALSQALRRRADATHSMDPQRRIRCEAVLSELQDAIAALTSQPPVITVQYGSVCHSALDACSRQQKLCTQACRALRSARVEIESGFDALYHPTVLEGFDWSMAQARETAAMPAVLAAATAEAIARDLTSFARLLRSGYPVQILIDCPAGFDSDLGLLPLAYPEAFVLSTSMAVPDRLGSALKEMAETLRPAVALLATSDSVRELVLLADTGAWPLYRYNPELGETLRERFAVQAPVKPALSFAHAAAAIAAFRDHFRVLPSGESAPDSVPSIAVQGPNGATSTAIYTRALANLSAKADRRRRLLTECAAPQTPLQADPNLEQSARLAGAAEAIQRAVAILASPENIG